MPHQLTRHLIGHLYVLLYVVVCIWSSISGHLYLSSVSPVCGHLLCDLHLIDLTGWNVSKSRPSCTLSEEHSVCLLWWMVEVEEEEDG